MKIEQKEFLQECCSRYESDLLTNIMPFWLKNGLDTVNGGLYTCVDRDGTLIDTTKSVWFQGRFAYVCSLVYNKVKKDQHYLDAAKSILDFIEAYCFDTDGHMFFEVTAEGSPVRRRRYIFSECFAIIAMAEYSLATGDSSYSDKAVDLLKKTLVMMETPGFLEAKYMPNVKMQGLSPIMILVNTVTIVKQVSDDAILDELLESCLTRIEKYFVKDDIKAVLETVGEDGELIDTCQGRIINPGHVIELAWFLIEATKNHPKRDHYQKLALKIFEWSWNWGWDTEFGGIINFRDCKNLPVQDYSQDMKFWWPQCETIIASLMAYELSPEDKYLEMHKLVHDWAYKKFPDLEFGEWYGYLHRDGTVAQPAKGNIFKGPFHIPRMMTVAMVTLQRLLSDK